MGRPRDKNRELSVNLSFSFRHQQLYPGLSGQYSGTQIIDEIDRIANREKCSRSKIIVCGLAEYIDRHGLGNSQTLLSSYDEGGLKSDGQIEQEIIQYFIKRQENHYEVNAREIGEQVRLNGVKGDQTSSTIDRIVKQLLAKEVRVIQ